MKIHEIKQALRITFGSIFVGAACIGFAYGWLTGLGLGLIFLGLIFGVLFAIDRAVDRLTDRNAD